MTALAPYLRAFMLEHLPRERNASLNTIETYAYSFKLLVCFAATQLNVKPCQIEIEQLDVSIILAFLQHIERERRNSARTRNARLAAIHSFFRFLEYRLVSCLDQACQIHAIPMKKTDEPLVSYLSHEELLALLNAPDTRTVSGVRDRAMLHLAFSAGLRVSELVTLRMDQLDQQTLATIHIMGKGRRERVLPLWKETANAIKKWLAVRRDGDPELFHNAAGHAMTRSGFEYILTKHVTTAARKQPSIKTKRVTPHVLRHTCALRTLQATKDVRKVSLWLGHANPQSTEIYLRADPTANLEALAAVNPPTLKPGRFQVPDKLLAMLQQACRPKNM
jgi:integrase/recombinase XerD